MRDLRPATEAVDRLLLAQWLSPAFPVGSFTFSQGLETAIAAGDVRDEAGLVGWISAVLQQGSARSDAILLAHARDPDGDLGQLDALARALAASAERLAETLETGGAFGAMMAAIDGAMPPELPYPLAVGLATRRLSLPTGAVLALFLQAQAAALVSAAVRFMPLGQGAGQRVLAALAPVIASVAAEAAAAPLDAIGGFTLRADLAGMTHETLETRIFRS